MNNRLIYLFYCIFYAFDIPIIKCKYLLLKTKDITKDERDNEIDNMISNIGLLGGHDYRIQFNPVYDL